MNITKQELQEIIRRCNAASPGPWKSYIEGRDHTSGSSFIQTGAEDIELSGASIFDQDFIAAARQDIPKLVAVLAYLNGWSV